MHAKAVAVSGKIVFIKRRACERGSEKPVDFSCAEYKETNKTHCVERAHRVAFRIGKDSCNGCRAIALV